jgi:hypothetical protein
MPTHLRWPQKNNAQQLGKMFIFEGNDELGSSFGNCLQLLNARSDGIRMPVQTWVQSVFRNFKGPMNLFLPELDPITLYVVAYSDSFGEK